MYVGTGEMCRCVGMNITSRCVGMCVGVDVCVGVIVGVSVCIKMHV